MRASWTRRRCRKCRRASRAKSSSRPEVFQGYWKRPDATAQAFIEHDGKRFFRSGDLGRVDEDGYFFITDRLKRMINAVGFKVWPAEVEALMFRHPAIQEACIISTKDAYRGESVKAVVVLRQSHRGQVSERTSSPGAATTWRSTRCRAWCSLSRPCPRAAAAR
jgi:acyl-CoA synthetase (AMP-forming)/AMP-acid ligase II